tara:strand:+ start:302 stop:559 length:258 start_codon:yes stop_codon:yes gene_type:complete
MKEQTLLEMKKKIAALTNVMREVFNEIGNLRDLSVGTLETLKLMPGYTEAIETLKTNMIEQNKKENETKTKTKTETETETGLLEL